MLRHCGNCFGSFDPFFHLASGLFLPPHVLWQLRSLMVATVTSSCAGKLCVPWVLILSALTTPEVKRLTCWSPSSLHHITPQHNNTPDYTDGIALLAVSVSCRTAGCTISLRASWCVEAEKEIREGRSCGAISMVPLRKLHHQHTTPRRIVDVVIPVPISATGGWYAWSLQEVQHKLHRLCLLELPRGFHQVRFIISSFPPLSSNDIRKSDPKIVKEIAVTRRKEFPKPDHAYEALRLFGENIVTAIDEEGEWKKHRLVKQSHLIDDFTEWRWHSVLRRSIVGPAFSEGNNAFVADSTKYHLNKLMDTWNQDMQNGTLWKCNLNWYWMIFAFRWGSGRSGRRDG